MYYANPLGHSAVDAWWSPKRNITNTTSKWFIYCSSTDPDTNDHTLNAVRCITRVFVCVKWICPYQIHCWFICVSMECAILTCLCGVFISKRPSIAHTHQQKKILAEQHTKKKPVWFPHTLAHAAYLKAASQKFQQFTKWSVHGCFVSLRPIHQ